MRTSTRPYVVLLPEDHVVLGEESFGMPGLVAVESIGPFAPIEASGPLVTVHDSVVEAGLGIGHHPHRSNERLFYIEQGELAHDDALNGISGHMDTGDVGQFVEGRRGMVHSEWNHGDVDCHAYILVSTTDPVPPDAEFHVLKDRDAPRYEEDRDVRTKELVGPRSPLRVHGDIRLFVDSVASGGASIDLALAPTEGAVVNVREGGAIVDDEMPLPARSTLIAPPVDSRRTIRLSTTEASRIVRVVHGPGLGFVVNRRFAPSERRRVSSPSIGSRARSR
jgi:redox-sensitive bicupin YhaK (pirin superfamily)